MTVDAARRAGVASGAMETNPFRASRPPHRPRQEGSGGHAGADESVAARVRSWVTRCTAGRRWTLRAPLLLILGWILMGYLGDAGHTSIFSGVTLGFHEMGHAALSWLGNRILTAAGGTLFQVAIPVAAAAYLAVKQRDPFGAAVCLFWLGTSLVEAGHYAADARAQALPLVSPFGPVDVDSHDWTVLLMKFGMLSKDQSIGGALVAAGRVVMVASLVAGAWVLRVMAGARGNPEVP